MKNNTSKFLQMLNDYFVKHIPIAIGASENTIKSYKYAFQLLMKYMYCKHNIAADEIAFSHLDYETLQGFLDWLESERGCCPSTKNQRLSALMAFSKYAQNRDFEAASTFRNNIIKIPQKRTRNKERAVLSVEEVKYLLQLPNDKSEIGLRDKVLLSTMYATGARAQEVCNLTVRDIQFNDRGAHVCLYGKGGKSRRVSIPDNCSELLKGYLSYRNKRKALVSHIFSSQTNEHMSVSCVGEIFKKYIRLAKENQSDMFLESNYSPHSMRHSTASHMLEAGVPLVVIKNFLGHSSLQSTQIYAKLSSSTVDKHLRMWNEKWFAHETLIPAQEEFAIPRFLNT